MNRTERARIAGLTAALNDPSNSRARRAHLAAEERFKRQAELDLPGASPHELAVRAALLRRLHFAKLSAAGVAARKAR